MEDGQLSREKQTLKTRSMQESKNKDVVNEDSYYKFMAYTGNLEKKRRENLKEVMNDATIYAGFDCFENFYQDHLLDQAKVP